MAPSVTTIPPVDCGAAMRQLWDYLDGELTADRMEAIRRHLESCDACLPHADFGRRFLDALHELRPAERQAPDAIRAKVRAALAGAGLPS
jgi:anti-sigma factor (TIGR02949 family)